MDYGQTSLGSEARTAQPKAETPLDRISYFADRIESANEQINRFNSRFYSEPDANKGANVRAAPSCHLGQIERLGCAIDDLCKTIERLSEIG